MFFLISLPGFQAPCYNASMDAESQLPRKQTDPPGSAFQIGTPGASALGLGVFGFILLLGWGQPFSHAGLWAGLLLWAAIAGRTVRVVLKTGRLNPYRLQFFAALALGTILAVLLSRAPGAGAYTGRDPGPGAPAHQPGSPRTERRRGGRRISPWQAPG